MEVDETSNQSATESHNICAEISSGLLFLRHKNGRSKIWEAFSTIVDKDGNEKNFVCCNNCKRIFKYSGCTSNLFKHKCFSSFQLKQECSSKVELNEESKRAVTKLTTKWIIKNCRPYSIVSDSGLVEVLEHFITIGNVYGSNVDVQKVLPHPTTIARNVSEIYEECLKKTKEDIHKIKDQGFSITCDIWTDDYIQQSYLAVTIHFLKDCELKVKLLGFMSMEGESCTGENILEKVQTIISDFGCELNDTTIVVTDGGANIKKAFESYQNISCICQLLNNTLQRSIDEVNEVSDLVNRCTKLVKFFKESGLDANLTTSLKCLLPTRWNTIYYMLASIDKNWPDICEILQKENELIKIDNINIANVKALIKILQHFEEASKSLASDKCATMHLALIYVHQLKSICTFDFCDSEIILSFKQKLRLHLNATVDSNITVFHNMAVFLFPPTNKLLQFSDTEKQFIENECIRIIKSFHVEEPHYIKEEPLTPPSPVCKYKKLFLDFVEQDSQSDSTELVTRELQLYKNTKVSNNVDFDVFKWWEFNKNNFPYLYKLSRLICTVPASSSSSERVFSAARNFLSEKSSSLCLNEIGVSQLIFTHFNSENVEMNLDLLIDVK